MKEIKKTKHMKNKYLESISKFGINLSLDRITNLLDLMENPQDKLRFVHVAGTNGKGSTCAMMASVLTEAGYKVGKFISPHLEEFNERISVNNVCISDDDIDRIVAMIKEKISHMTYSGFEHPTQFEIICAVAFQYFYEQGCDVVVLEVGLGGRLDSTNVIKSPLVSVITSISYDHTDRLGNSLIDITAEKAGIIKAGCPVVCYPQVPEVFDVLERTCLQRKSALHKVIEKNIISHGFEDGCEVFDFEGYKNLGIRLLGKHQLINASVAIKALEQIKHQGFDITGEAILRGLRKAEHKGRFEVLGHEPEFVIDGAHNLSGIETLKESLLRYYKGKKIVLLMAVLSTKDFKGMVDIISPISNTYIASQPVNDKALPAEKLASELSRFSKDTKVEPEIGKAVELAVHAAGTGGVVCCFGSLYFVGYVRQYYNNSKN